MKIPDSRVDPLFGLRRIMLEGFWPQTGFRIDLTGSGGPSCIQVGPRGSDFRGLGALKPKFKAKKSPKQISIEI